MGQNDRARPQLGIFQATNPGNLKIPLTGNARYVVQRVSFLSGETRNRLHESSKGGGNGGIPGGGDPGSYAGRGATLPVSEIRVESRGDKGCRTFHLNEDSTRRDFPHGKALRDKPIGESGEVVPSWAVLLSNLPGSQPVVVAGGGRVLLVGEQTLEGGL